MEIGNTLLSRIGNTPLIPVDSPRLEGARLMAKLEWFNPFGSVKDRAAYWMIRNAIDRGLIKPRDTIIIEPTSGNTGIALAGIGKAMGFRVEIVLPSRSSPTTSKIIENLGGKLIRVGDELYPELRSPTDKAITLAEEMVRASPQRYYMPNQFENEANYRAHLEGTGPEIWRDTNGEITHLFAGSGTGGTITGAGTYLKRVKPSVKVIGIQPKPGHRLQGLRSLKEAKTPGVLARRAFIVDEWIEVDDEDAFKEVRRAALEHRLLIGPSSGAVLHAAQAYLKDLKDGLAVVVLADDGRKFKSLYLELGVFSNEEYTRLEGGAKMLPKLPFSLA